jgi:hypothetical protein
MGSFQIVYDDFSGGQYMGPKSTNLPKNSWHGNNVIAIPNGRLCPVGYEQAGSNAGVASATGAQIMDSWTVGAVNYSFVIWSGTTSKMCRLLSVNNGSTFPIGSTDTSLTGTLGGKVAFVPAEGKFYYVNTNSGTFGYIRSVTTGGTDASVSTALGSGTGITNLALYGYRLVAWGPTTKRLYYSDTALTGWATSQYYEFNGQILNVLPRTNDLLVICDTGVFSVVGVLGSSITIQQIVPQQNVTEGMRDATIVGRNVFFLDQQRSGALDGNIYRMVGSSVDSVATMDLPDVVAAEDGYEKGRIQSISDGRIVVVLRNGIVYTQTSHGRWARLLIAYDATETGETNQITIARPGPEAQNEYFIVGIVQNDAKFPIKWYRVINNVITGTDTDQDFVFFGSASASTSAPTGEVELAEYWHSKPFTVKEVLVEWEDAGNDTPQVALKIEPTGLVDVDSADYTQSDWAYAQETSTPGNLVLSRLRGDDGPRGYGAKPIISFTAALINRVILICED